MTLPEALFRRFIAGEVGAFKPDSLTYQRIRRIADKVADHYEGRLYDAHVEIENLKGELGWIKEGKPYAPLGAAYAEPRVPEEGEPRQYTMEEIREKFLRHIWAIINHWEKEKDDKRSALEGAAFSILVTLDGESADLPAFAVLPLSGADDQKFFRESGENWYPLLQLENAYDMGGSLHDHFFAYNPKKEGD